MSRPRGRSRAGGEGPSAGGLMQPGNSEENLYKAVLRASEGKKGTGWGPGPAEPAYPAAFAALEGRLPRPRRASPLCLRAISWCAAWGAKARRAEGAARALPSVPAGGAFPRPAWTLLEGAAAADPRQVLPEEGKPLRPKVPSGIAEPGRRGAAHLGEGAGSPGCCLSEAAAPPGPKGVGWQEARAGRLVGACAGAGPPTPPALALPPLATLLPSRPLARSFSNDLLHPDLEWIVIDNIALALEGRFSFYDPEHPIINKADQSIRRTAASSFLKKGCSARILGKSQAACAPANCWDAGESLVLPKSGLA